MDTLAFSAARVRNCPGGTDMTMHLFLYFLYTHTDFLRRFIALAEPPEELMEKGGA